MVNIVSKRFRILFVYLFFSRLVFDSRIMISTKNIEDGCVTLEASEVKILKCDENDDYQKWVLNSYTNYINV